FLVAILLFTWRAPRTDQRRAALLMWGGWLLVTGAVFSLAKGIFHAYYNVALAPAIGALVGIGAVSLWRRRDHLIARLVLAVSVAGTAVWSFVLLDRSPTWHPWLRIGVVVLGLGAGLVIAAWRGKRGRVATTAAIAALLAALAGPAAYSLNTAATPHTGAIPGAGPTVSAGFGRGPGQGPGGFRGAFAPGAGPVGGGPPPGAFAGPPLQGSQSQNGATGGNGR